MTDIYTAIASQLQLDRDRVEATLSLLDDGATIPFISRYRKERTGGLNELQIRDIQTLAENLRELEKRKSYVTEFITAAGAMTDDLA
ncbi:MAG: RNA-binding transcriptional accessory protein, partial [Muribaculaceae bacterium]|nr:RNA-binding transcriptional accessory protein [Muribaculaceae bacterium]